MIKPQQYQYWKMMTITPFIFVNNFFILYSNFYHFLFACVDCAYDRLDYFDGDVFINNCFIYVCYTLDSLILNLFVLATVEESSLNSSSYLYYCSLSKFLTKLSLYDCESLVLRLFLSVSPSQCTLC